MVFIMGLCWFSGRIVDCSVLSCWCSCGGIICFSLISVVIVVCLMLLMVLVMVVCSVSVVVSVFLLFSSIGGSV